MKKDQISTMVYRTFTFRLKEPVELQITNYMMDSDTFEVKAMVNQLERFLRFNKM